ncbi:unnamed protein product [Musa acuminata subsp. malaccensis]|uniref:(wild Malaysian banana) hypothetical protein n=1 Tax=Musa acuminata subsp. malaccensis TaxID=214687 RepID=A0A804HLX2_MUSAM|nr:PREDICTED: uncharacterized protein LOC103974753 [Musa acuminata subsp. malaccensis]CAG1857062.1 unnamed protein product [Musa acuminata subsp. malaccensis]
MTSSPSPATTLLGPPEIRHPPPTSVTAPPPQPPPTPPPTGDPLLDLMDAGFNADPSRPPMGLTENLSPTYISSGDSCLDFFFQVVPGTAAETVAELLSAAWAQDAATALKLACHLRGVRGTGKSDRDGFYAAALWLHRHHPKTLALNLLAIADFGYLKDLPEILHRLIAGDNVRAKAKAERPHRGPQGRCFGRRPCCRQSEKLPPTIKAGTREERIAADLARGKILSAQSTEIRRTKRTEMAIRAIKRHTRDPDYRLLYDRVADVFAELLAADLRHLSAGEVAKISLAAKWCPSIAADLRQVVPLGRKDLPRRCAPRLPPELRSRLPFVSDAHYAYRVRDRLRRAVLVPLRRAIDLPEVYMSAGQWSILPYSRVASVAMKNYKKHFLKHDRERFTQYLDDVKKGKAKIAAGALLPHEIVKDSGDEVAELQWKRMVEDLSKIGSLRNCIAVCDVSGSMDGTPMEVSVALGLLISELSEEPWKGRVITFSERPMLHRIEGESLQEKTRFVRMMDWGMNTDFQKVFDKMLDVAVEGRLPADGMVRRVFVFSDMEFDRASPNPWETDYEAIRRKFEESGYGEAVPEVVFWNLRGTSRSTPVVSTQKGVALVSGFSKNMVKLFLEGDGQLSPREVMSSAISGREYEKLVLFD